MSINLLTFLACICFIFIIGRIFILPIKLIIKLAFNSIIGGVIILLINLLLKGIGIHIGLNIVTSILVGILGIPGAILLIIITLIF